jgi:SAM-dependent methyltransferase
LTRALAKATLWWAAAEARMGDYRHHDWAAETQFGRYLSQAEHDLVSRGHELAATPGVVLDIGAAGGRWSLLLKRKGWSNIITDVNALSVERCRDLMPDAQCHLVDPDDHSLPAQDASLGMVVCIEVFMVVGEPWFRDEVARALQPGGLFVGEFNNKWSWRGLLHHAVTRLRGGWDYYSRGYLPWKKQLEQAGFVVEYEEGFSWMPFGRHSNSPLIKAAVRLEKALGLRRLIGLSPTVMFVARKTGEPQPARTAKRAALAAA